MLCSPYSDAIFFVSIFNPPFAAAYADTVSRPSSLIIEQMYRYRLEYVKDARAHSILISEHKDIIDKLSKKDEENTKIVIRQHITNQEKGIIRLLNK